MAEGYLQMRFFQRLRQRRNQLTTRRLRDVSDPLDLPETLFINHYRLNQETFVELCNEIRPLVMPSMRNDAIPLELEVLTTLSFLATGSYQKIVGLNFHSAQSQKSVSRSIELIVSALNLLMITHIQFPRTQIARNKIKQGFYEKLNFPGVLGCIDGTHVKILKPTQHEEVYYCRKGFHSINATAICESNLIIIGICAKFGGSAHDAHVWRAMRLRPYIEDIRRNGETFWLLGDSAYPLRSSLMTPILHALPDTPEGIYTDRQSSVQNCIERCFGVLKGRWRCLTGLRGLHYTPQKAGKIINACAVLHNIAIKVRLPDPELVEEVDDETEEERRQREQHIIQIREQIERGDGLAAGQLTRQELIVRLLNE